MLHNLFQKKHAGSPYKNELPALIKKRNPSGLGLVAETLFMAVLLHALLALVLVDLCFAAFLNGAHGLMRGWGFNEKFQGTSLLRGYSMIPSAPRALRSGIMSLTSISSITVSTATQPASER